MAELQEQGVEALSRYDREIAFGGNDALALQQSTWLVGNHIRYFTEKLTHCDEPVQHHPFRRLQRGADRGTPRSSPAWRSRR